MHESEFARERVRPDLEAAAAIEAPVVTRFAPSPTGYLHLGHVVNAIYVWGVGRRLGAHILLRLEDHDRIRCRPAFEASVLEDLDWLGFVPDSGRVPPVRQSDRGAVYDAAFERLCRDQQVFSCECSRRDIGGERYDGRCRHRAIVAGPGRGSRLRIEPGAEPFHDLLLGAQRQTPREQCGDLLIRDRDGHWTYHFAATVDDADQRVTLVVRGIDLLSSTGRQIRLARMIGRSRPPRFLHHPLVRHPDGRKLSKSSGDTGVRELRARGLTPADVIGTAALAAGLIDRPQPIAAGEVPRLFPSSDATADAQPGHGPPP